MATATEKPEVETGAAPLAVPVWREADEGGSRSEQYLAKRLRAAAADHRSVAWSTFLAGTAVGLLAWLFLGVLAEHWLVAGGLPTWARAGWLLVAVAGVGLAVARWLLPLLRYRINLVYAARTLEQGHPDLHNDLVNTVLLREHPEGIPETVVHSLRRRTARGLARQPGDLVADRSHLLTMVYALAALVVLACLYQLISPKNLLVSAARLAAPWTRIMPPTRVRIEPAAFAWRMPPREGRAVDGVRHPLDVQRGEVTLHRGRQLIVSTTIRGRRRGEQPEVRVVPLAESGRPEMASAWTLPMVRRSGGSGPVDAADQAGGGDEPTARREVYEVVLPGGDRGMDRPAECTILAGDGQTEPVRVVLVDVPSLLVREVRYEFPDYTRRPPESVQWQGDLRALEGTRVTLITEASLPLTRGWIDFGCDGKHDWELTIPPHDLATGRATFPLRLNAARTAPWADSYQLQMELASAGPDEILTEEVRHRIEVIADLPPEVRIVKPVEQAVTVPPEAPVAVQIAAHDPDFAIRRVGLEYRVFTGDQLEADGLAWQPEGQRVGPFSAVLSLTPADVGAAAGSRIEYRAVVEDNREPKANRGVSHRDEEAWPQFLIDAKAPPQPVPPPQPSDTADTPREPPSDGEAENGQQSQENPERGGASQDGQQGEDEPGDQDGAQQGDNDGPQDGGQQDGGDGQQQGTPESGTPESGTPESGTPESGTDGQQSSGGQSGESGQGEQGSSGEGAQASPSDAEQGATEGQGGAEQGDGEPAAGGQQGEGGSQGREGETGPPEGEPIASDGTQDGEAMERILEHRRQAEEQGEGQQGQDGSQSQQGEGQQGQDGSQSQQGEGQQGQDGSQSQQGEGQQGEGQQGEGQQGEGQQGEGQQGEGQQGEGQQGEGQQGEGQQGEGQQGEGQQGEGQQGQDGSQSQQGEGQQGEGQQGEGQQGEGQQGEGQQGEGQQGEGQQGEGQQGEGQQGEGQQGQDGSQSQQGEGQQGEGQQGEGQQGEGQQGEGQQGEGQQGEGQQGQDGSQSQQGEGQQGEGQQGEGQQGEGQQGQDGSESQQGESQQGEGQQGRAAGGGDPQQGQAGDLGQSGDTRGMAGQGSWSDGEGQREGGDAEATPSELEWGDADLEHARNATDLAIEHLRDSLEAGDQELLEQLGWSEAQARAFLARWDAMQRLQRSENPADRVEFERAVRSLGLRPEGMQTRRRATRQQRDGEAEGTRSRPPNEYLERVRAYTEGLSTQ